MVWKWPKCRFSVHVHIWLNIICVLLMGLELAIRCWSSRLHLSTQHRRVTVYNYFRIRLKLLTGNHVKSSLNRKKKKIGRASSSNPTPALTLSHDCWGASRASVHRHSSLMHTIQTAHATNISTHLLLFNNKRTVNLDLQQGHQIHQKLQNCMHRTKELQYVHWFFFFFFHGL